MRAAAADTYDDVRADLDMISRSHFHRYNRSGGDYAAVRADADSYFLVALEKYDPRQPFRPWLWFKVSNLLLEDRRKELNRLRLIPRESGDVELDSLTAPPTSDFDLNDFIDGLGPDAAEVVRLIFRRSPTKVVSTRGVRTRGLSNKGGLNKGGAQQGGSEQGGVLSTATEVVRCLRQLGWAAARITESFNQIKEAL